MAATTVGLVYSATTGRLRSVVSPDDDDELTERPLGPGEAMHTIPMAQYAGQSMYGLQAILNEITGLTPSGDRYISVDASGNVVSQHIADPACGDVSPFAGCSLIAHPTANRGDHYVNGVVRSPTHATAQRAKAKWRVGVRANQLVPTM